MSQGNSSCLRFSLEESVWFQRGQEVSQLISISLDPNITIQESDQYVTIQGALELTGEYERIESDEVEAVAETSAKFVQTVEERDGGICEFTHFFPVDITIPNNRIQSVQEIDVEVESFDYVFPERGCMKLNANLTISGLYGDQQHGTEQEQPSIAEVQVEQEVPEEELEPLFRNAAPIFEPPKQWADEEEEEKEEKEEDFVTELTIEKNEEERELYIPFKAEAKKQPEAEPQAVRFAEEQEVEKEPNIPEVSFAAHRFAEVKQPEPVAAEIESPAEEVKYLPSNNEKTAAEPEVESSSSPEEVKSKKGKSKKKSMTLTEFFARKEENELTKLKVCIVQNGDTVDGLAEKYDVSPQSLLRVNHLELNQDIYEGQVLYIPVSVTN